MSASVICRFAKIVTVAAVRRRDSAWAPRLAVSVPLAAIVAVGAVGCSAPKGGSAAGQPSAAPSVTASAPSSAAPSAAPSFSPTAAPTTPAAPTTAPVQQVGHRTSGKPVAIEFHGLDEGQKLTAGGDQVAFSVTWTNTTDHRLNAVAPVVAAEPFAGARCRLIEGQAGGRLEREDANGWTGVRLSEGTGMDYATSGDNAAFPLAPGASRTVQYRIQLGADNGPAPLALDAEAYVAGDPSFKPLGKAVQHLTVVDDHRPTAGMPSMTPIPTSVTAGGPAVEVEVSTGNFTKAPFGSLAPRLTLAVTTKNRYTDEALGAKNVSAEVFVKGAWKRLPVVDDCGGASVDTSSLATPSQNGPYGHVVNYLFRFSVASTVAADVTSLDVSAGAVADGHYAAPVTTEVAVRRQG